MLINIDMADAGAGPTGEALEHMTNGSGNDNHPRNRHPYRFYWLTGGLATIVAAIIGISVTHSSTGSVNSPGPSEPAPVSPGSPPASTSYTPRPSTASTYYQGPVTISGNGLDFDINPPSHGPATANFVYNTFALQGAGSNTVGFAVWKQGGTPTASKCATFVTTNQTSVVPNVTAGMKICFKTDQGRVGLLSVQPDTSANELHAITTVWNS